MDKPEPPHVIEGLDDISRRAPTADVTGAALRSIFVGALLVGGLAWVARVLFGSRRTRKGPTDSELQR
jgi:hypothetical protein